MFSILSLLLRKHDAPWSKSEDYFSRLFKFINIILYCTLNINFFNMLKSKGCQMHYIKRHSFFNISSVICFRWIHLNCEIIREVVLFKNVILSVVWNWHRNPVKFYFFSKVNSVEQNSIQRIYIIFVFCLIHAYDWRKTRLDFIWFNHPYYNSK